MKDFTPDFASTPEFARLYRQIGMQVVPAKDPTESKSWKRPALVSWREFEKQLTPDDQFNAWYGSQGEHRHRSNIGIITGSASGGIFVIDADFYKNQQALAWWKHIEDAAPSLADLETVTQTTGGGGKQFLFRSPAGWVAPTTKTSIGIDIRGEGGFAVIPPSLHESGRRYQWDEGKEPWSIDFAIAPKWLCDEIDKLTGSPQTHQGGPVISTPSPDYQTNSFGLLVDGREDYATKMIWAHMVDLRRDAPMISQAFLDQEMLNLFQLYERNVRSRLTDPTATNADLLEREGRGISMFKQKWDYAAKQWETKVAEHAKVEKPQREKTENPREPVAEQYTYDPETGEIIITPLPEGALEYLDVKQIKSMPDPKFLVEGLIAENSFGIIGGAPGSGKTFITLNLALSIAAGSDQWFDRGIRKTGPIVYISSEGLSDMKYRIMAWEQFYTSKMDEKPFFLIRQSLNFMDKGDIMRLLTTVAHIAKLHGKPELIVIDTVSRVLPGADENLQKDMTIFIAACDAVRNAFASAVIGVHHTSRAGNLRGSTVFEGAADFILMVERESGEEFGSMRATKIKYAPDGWDDTFEMRKVATGLIGGQESLVAVKGDKPEPVKTKWPERDILEKVLYEMQRDFEAKKGWSMSRNAHHQATRHFVRITGVTQDIAKEILEAWQTNGVIAVDLCDKATKKMGLKVVGSIR